MLAYQEKIDEILSEGIQCPPANASAVSREAWRWVRNPITPDCMKPVADRNPKRLQNASGELKCSCWALSMYASQSQSIAAFEALQRKHPKIKKLIGDHVATVNITPAVGLCTPNERNGHFDFFPFATSNVVSLMTIQAAL